MNYTQSELNQLIEQLKTLLATKLDPAFVKKEGGTLDLEVGEIGIRVNVSVWGNEIILKDDFLRYASFGNMRIFVDEIAEPYQHTGRAEKIGRLCLYIESFIRTKNGTY